MYAPEHEEQPVQSFQVHFNAHVWTFDAHQLLHNVVPAVEQKEHPAQSGKVHFIVHSLDLGAHQLLHGAATVMAVPEVVPEHGGHAAQRGQVHFIDHGLDLGAHQLSHSVASHFGSTLVDPTVLVNLPGGHFFWAMH